jgi:hypothetical protein
LTSLTHNKLFKSLLFPAIYILAFILLFACYTSASFPLGDDASHLVWGSFDPLPQPRGWIANRVVNSFFCRYLFLLFFPVDKAITGAAFFESFSRYAGLLNAAVAMLLVAICSHSAISGLRVNIVLRLATFFCSLAFVLMVVWGDLTLTVSYNLTLLICLIFIFRIIPLSRVTDLPESTSSAPVNEGTFHLLIVAGYFTAFGLELFTLFAWIYFFSVLISTVATWPSTAKLNIQMRLTLAAGSIISFRKKSIFLYYGLLTLISIYLLRSSGRTVTGIQRESVSLSRYSSDFLRAILTHRISIFWIACLVIIVIFCFIRYRETIKSMGNQQNEFNALIHLRPLVFFLVVTISYYALLFIAGYKDGTVFIARSASPTIDIGRIGRSSLFLSPLILVNLALCLRCIVITLATQKKLAPIFVLGSFLLLLSSSNRFLLEIREQAMLQDKVAEAFVKASTANTDTIEIPFYRPSRSGSLLGFPVLPSVDEQDRDWDWYRGSYRLLFKYYYGKEFSERGPLFK